MRYNDIPSSATSNGVTSPCSYFLAKPDESLVIGDNITVTVLGISGATVRIGIDAPRELTVDRHEIRERKLEHMVDEVKGDAGSVSG